MSEERVVRLPNVSIEFDPQPGAGPKEPPRAGPKEPPTLPTWLGGSLGIGLRPPEGGSVADSGLLSPVVLCLEPCVLGGGAVGRGLGGCLFGFMVRMVLMVFREVGVGYGR